MRLNRRQLVQSLAAAPLVAAQSRVFAASPVALAPAKLRPAIAAIAAYAEQHRRTMGVPGLTIGLTAPDLASYPIRLGFTDTSRARAVGPDTLFQVGSISKLMTATMIHQLAAEGKLALDGDVRAMLPGAAWPDGAKITLQQLLDHVSGLPGDAPLFPPEGKLWFAFQPGAHWLYSNTGYGLLGLIVERAEQAPLATVLHRRLFAPLGMTRSRGSILSADRLLYAQGYEPAKREIFYTSGDALSPASWTDVTEGAGSVASTADDMMRLLRSIIGAATGKGGLGLSPALASAFTGQAVDTVGGPSHGIIGAMRYGNGLMHVADAAKRPYFHHTGGMPSFTSSFHIDPASGVGAFASVPLGYPANYRPRLLTMFAVQALTAAAAGDKLPDPPSLATPKPDGTDFIGNYTGPKGSLLFANLPGGFTAAVDRRNSPMIAVEGDIFTTRLAGLESWPIEFVRKDKVVVAVNYGPDTYVRHGATYAVAPSDPALALLAGRFQNDSAWNVIVTVAERGGKLYLSGFQEMTHTGDLQYRTGDEWSSPRIRFADLVDGRPQTLIVDGTRLERRDI